MALRRPGHRAGLLREKGVETSSRTRPSVSILVFVLLVCLPTWGAHAAGDAGSAQETQAARRAATGETIDDGSELGQNLALWWAAPFAGILLSIAICRPVAPEFWDRHHAKIASAWGILFAVPFVASFGFDAVHAILHIYLNDYVHFIILLWGLFTVAGGIVIRGSFAGTPASNTALLLVGTAMASWIGTTGAAMVMIRPLLRANARRKSQVHVVVFFTFLVANIGGSLTPLGDPPLFLGFLHGVPFFWTTSAMLLPMLVLVGMLLALFYAIDTILVKRENGAVPDVDDDDHQPIAIIGAHNLLFLGGILASVLISGVWRPGDVLVGGVHVGIQNIARDALILLMGALSLITTSHALRRENGFSWGPIKEVASLFAAIFMTIVPALEILKAGESGALGWLIRSVQEPWHYYWVTGILSSFLDNAPTYLTFFNTELAHLYPGVQEPQAVERLIAEHEKYLLAVSAGAVFMGAITYIGNAPNFMLKLIAEEEGIAMPSFFGYILRWSLPILIPCFVVITFVFFV
jgi:Na+/H+ antiporter NhaD/arsenite permease-like protein